jgi:hypothetical protein
MLVPAELFLELGGFDELFAPAYFEDTDLCFKLHERGLRTIFEPRSRVVHIRHGSGTSGAARKLMEEHRDLFVERWAERLTRRPRLVEVAQKPNHVAARDAEALDRILVIDDRVPYTDRGSGDPRMAAPRELAAPWPSARITLAGPIDGMPSATPSRPPGHRGCLPRRSTDALVRGAPVPLRHGDRQQKPEHRTPKAATLAHTAPGPADLDTEAFSFRRLELQAEPPPSGEGAEPDARRRKARETEIRAVQEADLVFCVSDEESELISEIAPGQRAFVLTSIVDALPAAPGFDERADLVFFGGFLGGAASPNADSLAYLVEEVLPLFWEDNPDVGLNVIGADMDENIRALDGPRVRIVGYVEDPTGWLSRARLHVNPMRYGAGVKLKFLDSLAAGLPARDHVDREPRAFHSATRGPLVAGKPVRPGSV